MAKIIMKEYTLGVNGCYSVALSNTLSLHKSSFKNIILYSFGENKSVSSTKAIVQIHIRTSDTVQYRYS